jgi:hypothetical protein
VNFAECPDDGNRLKADPSHRVGARPVIMRCPACGKRYTFSDDGIVEVRAEDDPPPL